ncbi:ER membrane protein complex subunit 3 [Acrasis kona]|uniref:ER membrane protein complex subunit 3 n=1 Tax=Acrasis kona TaxID=1008807 RepID=A0AAW2ZIA7_9EUKA
MEAQNTQLLVLDSSIRNWVLLPIVLFMFLFGILRHYATIALRTTRKNDKAKLEQAQTLARAQTVRTNANWIPHEAFLERKAFFNQPETGVLNKKIPANTLASMADPNNMVDMMKTNFATIVPNIVMWGWVSYFFSGFVIAKFPFPLTGRFRGMVQRGIELNSLDVSYVTSASMYFLILFGLRGLFSLVLGEANAADDAQLMQQQMMGPAAAMAGPGVDMGKLFEAERDNLELVTHESKLKEAETTLLNSSQ